jgi:hypothetical protein
MHADAADAQFRITHILQAHDDGSCLQGAIVASARAHAGTTHAWSASYQARDSGRKRRVQASAHASDDGGHASTQSCSLAHANNPSPAPGIADRAAPRSRALSGGGVPRQPSPGASPSARPSKKIGRRIMRP